MTTLRIQFNSIFIQYQIYSVLTFVQQVHQCFVSKKGMGQEEGREGGREMEGGRRQCKKRGRQNKVGRRKDVLVFLICL